MLNANLIPHEIPQENDALLAARTLRGGGPPKSRDDGEGKRAGAGYGRVLMVGELRELALYRAEFLRSKGYTVAICAPPTSEEVAGTLRRGVYGAVVLSYTLPSEVVLE